MEILIHREGQQFGPYSIAEVQSYLSAGQLQPTDSAWHEGLPDWIPLDQIAGAVGTASAPPPPPPSRLSLPLDSPHEPKYAKKQCPRCQATVDMDAGFCTNCWPTDFPPTAGEDELGTGEIAAIYLSSACIVLLLHPLPYIMTTSLLYYVWREKYPNKAAMLNKHAWIAFVICLVIFFFLKVASPEAVR